jgi:hypothetical protein
MAQADLRSLDQIKREIEQTRAGLTETVDRLRTSVAETASDIRQRIKPQAIKAEVSDYIKSRGEQLLSDVTAAARRNPIQGVAVGASVAYPLLRLARTIPLPVLMVGAGLFFAGSKTGQAASQKASDMAADLSEQAVHRASEFGTVWEIRPRRRKSTLRKSLTRYPPAFLAQLIRPRRRPTPRGLRPRPMLERIVLRRSDLTYRIGRTPSKTMASGSSVPQPLPVRTCHPARQPPHVVRVAAAPTLGWMFRGR